MIQPKTYYGKYRATVAKNDDPLGLGRLQVTLPEFSGMKEAWALPCAPYAGPDVGFYAMPPVGACVWIEFEGGNPDKPIWSGCFWLDQQVPLSPPSPAKKVLKTESITMVLDDTTEEKGGFSLQVATPAVKTALSMTFDSNGITLTCPPSVVKLQVAQIEIDHPQGKITMTDDSITITVPAASWTMKASEVTTSVSPATLTVSEGGVKSQCGSAEVNVSTASVSTSVSPASTTVSPGSISLSLGAASVALSPASVSINEGALEVI